MSNDHSDRFRGRRFPEEIIVLCVRWYLRYCLSYRDLEEMMVNAGRALTIRRSLAGFCTSARF